MYSLRNILNGKVYVGSTGRNLLTRIKEHFQDLKKGKHLKKAEILAKREATRRRKLLERLGG